ncbi:MAG: metal-dependent hydrolase [Bacteroidota bacterium]
MKFTYWGHSCFSVAHGEASLLFDPFVSPNPLASHISLEAIQPTHIFISHGHEDHMADAISIADATNATVVSNFEVIQWLSKKGMKNGLALNIGGGIQAGDFYVKCTHAIHSSSMPDGSYGGTAMGFVASCSGTGFYYAGDTALTVEMKLIGEYFKPAVLLMPIGGSFTMDVADAIIAAGFCGCSNVIGLHYDTFEPIRIDKTNARERFSQSGIELKLLEIGESISIN